jgi:hypothetical protein
MPLSQVIRELILWIGRDPHACSIDRLDISIVWKRLQGNNTHYSKVTLTEDTIKVIHYLGSEHVTVAYPVENYDYAYDSQRVISTACPHLTGRPYLGISNIRYRLVAKYVW